MNDIIKPKIYGALLECFLLFPLFLDDYDCLVVNGFIEPVSPEQCKWLKSKTSLAEYFWWVGSRTGGIPGGFWSPISRAFGMNKGQLQKLAGRNGNWCKPDESRHFAALKRLVTPCRRKLHRARRDTKAFNAIKKLLNETKSNEPELIHDVLRQVETILCENVEKN